jgi:hypothetical protein
MSGWLIGWAIGAVVVALVAVLLVLMIVLASRAGDKAEDILSALEEARDNTAPLWRVAATNEVATRVVDAAAATRTALTPEEELR